ncbi:MAG: hypothetical protein GC184_12565 [Rhizobiales bacterium]|nr:hypothetical protein [Hyphomicrobiales bacterium]
MLLDVVSDTVCPWCYIGKRRLEMAVADKPQKFELRWRPYQLDPTIPEGGMDRREYLERKFGPERAKAAGGRIREEAASVGLTLNFDKIERAPNTLDSHRLLRWAGTAGCQNDMAEILFRRYFVDGEDIGDHAVLVDAAAEANMDTEIVAELLANGSDRDLVLREIEAARDMGINGVPTTVVYSKWMIVGAQVPETISAMLDRMMAKEAQIQAEAAQQQ